MLEKVVHIELCMYTHCCSWLLQNSHHHGHFVVMYVHIVYSCIIFFKLWWMLLSTSPHKNQTNSDTWQFSEFNDFLCKYSFYYTIQALKEFMKSDYSCYGYLHFANSLATTGYSLTDCIKFSYFEGVKICLDEIKYWYEAVVKKIDCLFC